MQVKGLLKITFVTLSDFTKLRQHLIRLNIHISECYTGLFSDLFIFVFFFSERTMI